MKYKEIIQFEPIESVVQLRDADREDYARELVSTYVISEEMDEKLTDLVFSHLQFDYPTDNKGLLVVGNYGTGLSALSAMPLDELVTFKHIERPKEWNIPALKALFELMGLAPGLASKVTLGDEDAVTQLQQGIIQSVEKLVLIQQDLHDRFSVWGRNILSEEENEDLRSEFERTKGFLESLQAYSSPGKLKNFRYNVQEVNDHKKGLGMLTDVEILKEIVNRVGPLSSYLSTAEAVLPAEHAWLGKAKTTKEKVLAQIMDPEKRKDAAFRQQMLNSLIELKKTYMKDYMSLHARARLGINEDKRKTDLMHDERLSKLQGLSSISLMPSAHLIGFQKRLADLIPCYRLTEDELRTAPVCPHCSYKPAAKSLSAPAAAILEELEDQLDKLLSDWTQTLLTNIGDPTTRENANLLKPGQRKLVDAFLEKRALPDDLGHDFIHALEDVLSGLIKVEVKVEDLRSALLAGGSPAAPDELKKRFEEYLSTLTKGKDPSKVRIVLE
jgi:hypothetical protein